MSTQDLFAHSLELAQGNWLVRHDLDRRGADAQVVPVLSLVFVAVGALVFANLVATLPGRIAACTPAAIVFRSE